MRRYEGRIYRFAARLCGNPEDARDITQEAFVRAFRMLERYDPSQEFGPWLFTVARRKAVDHLRASPPGCDEVLPEVASDDDVFHGVASRDEGGVLWDLARRILPDLQFQALWLHYAEDMDTAELAQVLNVSRTHAKVLLWRGRSILTRRLRPLALNPEGSPPLGQSAKAGLNLFVKGSI